MAAEEIVEKGDGEAGGGEGGAEESEVRLEGECGWDGAGYMDCLVVISWRQ